MNKLIEKFLYEKSKLDIEDIMFTINAVMAEGNMKDSQWFLNYLDEINKLSVTY